MTIKNFDLTIEQIDGLLNLIKTVQKQKHKKYSLETLIPYGVGCDVFILKIMSLVKKQDEKLFVLAGSLLKGSATVADIMHLKMCLIGYFLHGTADIGDKSLVYGEFDNKKELKTYEAFCIKHGHQKEKVASGKHGVAGWTDEGCYIKPVLTAIGTIYRVVCPFCGKEEDIADIDAW